MSFTNKGRSKISRTITGYYRRNRTAGSRQCHYWHPACKNTTINKNKLVLHVRETDYVTINAFLGYDFYKKLISDSDFKEFIIVTDNSKSETVQKLIKEDGCTLSTEGVVDTFAVHSDSRAMDDFQTLMYSENIAISQSSFSWWAAFLGNHKNIIFPYKKGLDWWPVEPGKDDIDLYFDLDNLLVSS